MTRRTLAVALLAFALAAGVANASWYDDYDAGIAAARAGNWNVVATKMSAAIKGNGTESNRARTYGAIFINYHPYYYRGVANLNLGRYEQAIADFEKTSGPGPENLGSIEALMERAKKQLAAASAPEPEPVKPTPVVPTPTPVTPAPVQPAAPTIDPALRSRASSALGVAKQKLQQAQQRRASGTPQYAQAMSMITQATTKNGTARTNDDLQSIISMAESAADLADLAMPPNVPAPTPTPATVTPRPAAAATAVMAEDVGKVRRALEYYFAGEFDEASRRFDALTRTMPNNAWIWAFLGASQYSQYAFEAEESYRTRALTSFKRAKQLRSWKGGLPDKYFSKRIRRAFNDEG